MFTPAFADPLGVSRWIAIKTFSRARNLAGAASGACQAPGETRQDANLALTLHCRFWEVKLPNNLSGGFGNYFAFFFEFRHLRMGDHREPAARYCRTRSLGERCRKQGRRSTQGPLGIGARLRHGRI